MYSLHAEVFFVNVHLWHVFHFYLAFLPTATFALCQLSHVSGGINVTRSSNFRGSYSIVKIWDLLMAMKLVRGEFSSMSRVCMMAYPDLCPSESAEVAMGAWALGLVQHWSEDKVLLRWSFQLCWHSLLSHLSGVFTVVGQWQCSEPRARRPLPYLYPLQAAHLPGGREAFPLGSVMCHLLFAEGGCCSILGHPICKQKHEL